MQTGMAVVLMGAAVLGSGIATPAVGAEAPSRDVRRDTTDLLIDCLGMLDIRPKSEIRFRLLAYKGPLVIRSIVPDGEAARVPVITFDLDGVNARLDEARKERESLLADQKKEMVALKKARDAGGSEEDLLTARLAAARAREALIAKEREIFCLRVDAEEMRNGARTARQGTVRYGSGDLRVGGTVYPGALLVTVQDEASLQIEIPVTARDAGTLKPGMPAHVTSPVVPDLTVEGVVEQMSPGVKRFPGTSDQTWRVAEEEMGETHTIRIGVPAKDPRLKPGSPCTVKIRTGRTDPAVPRDPAGGEAVSETLVDLYACLEEWYALLDEIGTLQRRLDPKEGEARDVRRPVSRELLDGWVAERPMTPKITTFLGLTPDEAEAVNRAFRAEAEAFRSALVRLPPPKGERDPQIESVLKSFGFLEPRSPDREPGLGELIGERLGRHTRTANERWQHGSSEAWNIKDAFCKEQVMGSRSSETEMWGLLEEIRLSTYKRLQEVLPPEKYVMATRVFGRFHFGWVGGKFNRANDVNHPRIIATWKGGLAHFEQDVAFMRRSVEKWKKDLAKKN